MVESRGNKIRRHTQIGEEDGLEQIVNLNYESLDI